MMQRAQNVKERRERSITEKAKLLKDVEQNETLVLHPAVHHQRRLVTAENLSLCYGDHELFRGVSFCVEKGDRIALTGKNGSGKTSLLKLIYGESIAYSGVLQIASNLKVSYVPQDISHLKGNPAAYAAACGVDESLFKAILRKLDFSRVQFDKDMADYSSGQKKKVLLARSLCEQAHLYIWDEPLNFVDVLSRIQIEELLLATRSSILFVEHDRAFLDKIATKTVKL